MSPISKPNYRRRHIASPAKISTNSIPQIKPSVLASLVLSAQHFYLEHLCSASGVDRGSASQPTSETIAMREALEGPVDNSTLDVSEICDRLLSVAMNASSMAAGRFDIQIPAHNPSHTKRKAALLDNEAALSSCLTSSTKFKPAKDTNSFKKPQHGAATDAYAAVEEADYAIQNLHQIAEIAKKKVQATQTENDLAIAAKTLFAAKSGKAEDRAKEAAAMVTRTDKAADEAYDTSIQASSIGTAAWERLGEYDLTFGEKSELTRQALDLERTIDSTAAEAKKANNCYEAKAALAQMAEEKAETAVIYATMAAEKADMAKVELDSSKKAAHIVQERLDNLPNTKLQTVET
ncbi:hypothetical protein BT63DRAFT_439504 [Microthyrium microscopicum]|uniref:Uncharacterized protein n=1 Tax=Microthyrium microscopicum TaxID=703497 RepID=A0A6A6UE81_9PEZI|nr:hypothetical protein BT63DRAFT_439504 [Microthyrium microscopicum]